MKGNVLRSSLEARWQEEISALIQNENDGLTTMGPG